MRNNIRNISPWVWVPTLYFTEGIPYFLVNSISVVLFAKMGVPNDQLSFFTTLLYFPWFLKGVWSPLVDVVKTKRWWIIAMQVLMTVICATLILSLPSPDPELMASKQTPVSLFRFTLILFIIMAFASATHDIAADGYYMLAHSTSSQARFIGIRSTFYRISTIVGAGVLMGIAGVIEDRTGDIPYSWAITLGIAAVMLFIVCIYHIFALPNVEQVEVPAEQQNGLRMWEAIKTFFTKPGILLAIFFMLLYRLPEGLLVKMSMPFLLDAPEVTMRDGQFIGGGLGLSTLRVSLVYGIAGTFFLLLGGILGGIYISRRGLKRSLWFMAALLTIPNLVYVYLSMAQPTDLWLIGSAISLEQFGYGFGFTAYMMYMMYFAQGEYKTSHYAICTAFMALSMMIPGFVAGKIQMSVGYTAFFWIAILCSVFTVLVTFFAHKAIDSNYGKN